MRTKNFIALGVLVLVMAGTFGCGRGLEPETDPLTVLPAEESLPANSLEFPALATPVSDSPAAGICAEFEGKVVTVTIRPDIPDPRCSLIQPDQILEVVNSREETLLVSIGQLEAELSPGESYLFDLAFGEYLAPGVHRVEVQPCCGAELWLQGE
jgi:hypothetical protein